MRLRCWSCAAILGHRFALVTGDGRNVPQSSVHLACLVCAGNQQEGQKCNVYLEPVALIPGTSVAHTVAQKGPKLPLPTPGPKP